MLPFFPLVKRVREGKSWFYWKIVWHQCLYWVNRHYVNAVNGRESRQENDVKEGSTFVYELFRSAPFFPLVKRVREGKSWSYWKMVWAPLFVLGESPLCKCRKWEFEPHFSCSSGQVEIPSLFSFSKSYKSKLQNTTQYLHLVGH